MVKDLWKEKDELKCDNCGSWAKPTYLSLEGHKVRGWKCSRCDMEYIHPEDAQKILASNKLRKQMVEVKVGKLGSNQIMRFPQEVTHALNVHAGDLAIIKLSGKDSFQVKIKHAHK